MKLFRKREKNTQESDLPLDEEVKQLIEEGELENKHFDRLFLAYDLDEKGDVEGAKKIYQELIVKRFDVPKLYENLAKIYAKQEQYQKAKEVLSVMVEVFTESSAGNAPAIVEKGEKHIAQLNQHISDINSRLPF